MKHSTKVILIFVAIVLVVLGASPAAIDWLSQVKNRPMRDIRESGCVCDNVADDTTKVATWLAALVTAGKPVTIAVPVTVYIPGGITLNSPHDMVFQGYNGGGFRGTAIPSGATTPIPSTLFTFTGVNSGSAVSVGSSQFHGFGGIGVTNSFAAEDMLMLSNFPTDAGGSDVCTHAADQSCSYPSVGAANLRQTRRREPVQVHIANSTAVQFYSPIVQDYASTQGLQLQKFVPASNISFRDINLSEIYLNADLFRNFSYRGGTAVQSWISVRRGLYANIYPDFFDAQLTDSAVAVGGSARFISIKGVYKGGYITTDNSLIRVDNGEDIDIQANLGGHFQPSGATNGVYGILIDTNYAEAPDGYTDVPTINVSIKAVDEPSSPLTILAACDPFSAPIYNLSIDLQSYGYGTLQLGGVIGGNIVANTPNGTLNLYGSQQLSIAGQFHGLYTTSVTDPRGISGPLSNSDIDFRGAKLVHLSTDSGSLTDNFSSFVNLRLSDMVFDFSQTPGASPTVQFSNVNNLYLGNVTMRHTSSQVVNFYAAAVTGDVTILGDMPPGTTGTWTRPTCDANHRFMRWNAAGSSDVISQCLSVGGSYSWVAK